MSLAPSRTGSSSPTRTGIVPIRRIASLRSNTSSRSAASIHSNNPISSRNSRSSAPSPAKSRDSTQFSTNSCAARGVSRRAAPHLVAGNPERERPTGRLGHQRGQSRARQFPIEEVRDLRFREPQFLCRHDRSAAFQHGAGDAHAGGELPARKRQVQVGRAALQQEFQQRRRARVRQPFQFIEHQHERSFEIRNLAHRKPGSAPAPASCVVQTR